MLLLHFFSKGQDLIFRISQAGTSYKSEKSGIFKEAELRNDETIITMQDKVVVVNSENNQKFQLLKLEGQNNNIKHLYTQIWKGTDRNNNPVQFKFTVNVASKEAMVEVKYPDNITYYFGNYYYGNLKAEENKERSAAKAF